MSEAEHKPQKAGVRVEPEGELVAVARAVKTRGLRGEIVADLLTDFPERFDELEDLIAVSPVCFRQTLSL